MNALVKSVLAGGYSQIDRRRRLTVATFHRVGPGSGITGGHVRHHLEYLARHFEVVSPRQCAGGAVPARAAMVTIDDGHRDLYREIFPAAASLRIPITVCAATDYVLRRRWLWFDRLEWVWRSVARGATAVINGRDVRAGETASLGWLKCYFKGLLAHARDAELDSLERQFGCRAPAEPVDGYEPMTLQDTREMLASGLMELCGHTVSHTIATVLPDAELRRELAQCRAELEALAGARVTSFCYPNGCDGDFSPTTRRAIRDTGFELAFTSVGGTNVQRQLDWYEIRRVHASTDRAGFELAASGFNDLRRRRDDSSCRP